MSLTTGRPIPRTCQVVPRSVVRITPASVATMMEGGLVCGSITTSFTGRSGRLVAGWPGVPLMSLQVIPLSVVR